jgi:hypothetical protein
MILYSSIIVTIMIILDVMVSSVNEVILEEFVVLGCQTIIEEKSSNEMIFLLKEDIDGSRTITLLLVGGQTRTCRESCGIHIRLV